MATETQAPQTNPRVISGVVASKSGDKSIVVRVDRQRRHPLYRKIVRYSRKIHVHDENNESQVGDTISAVESRPRSKLKRFTLRSVDAKAREIVA